MSADLLGSHVTRRADDQAQRREPAAQGRGARRLIGQRGATGNAEVEHLHPSGAGDHHVARLDVAVHDALGMRGGQRVGDLGGVAQRLSQRQPVGGNRAVERHAVDVLHHDEGSVALLLDAVDRDDAGVIQRRGGAGLVQKTAPGFSFGDLDHLDGHGAIEHRVSGPIHGAHAALPEAGLDEVVKERRTDHRCRRSYRP